PTRPLEGLCQDRRIEVGRARHRRPQTAVPKLPPVLFVGLGKVDQRIEAAGESLIQVGPQIRGEDRDPLEELHSLEKVSDLDIGIAVVGIAYLGALAKQCVGFIKEDYAVDSLGRSEEHTSELQSRVDLV